MAEYICQVCGKAYKDSTNLIIHMRTHTGERPFICEQCRCTFISQGNLNQHMLKHTGERPHKCKECGVAFFRSNILKQHMQDEHLQAYNELKQARTRAAEKAKECSICNITFATKSSCTRHKKRAHVLASTSSTTVTVHSKTEPVGEVTAVTQLVDTGISVNIRSTVESPLGRAEIVTQCLPAAIVTTVTQTAAKGTTLNTTPPVTLVSSLPVSSVFVSSEPDNSFAEDSDPNDISRLLPDSWLN